ncbi:hypothetical protein ACFTXM_41955, partial [Streptomyces sp. NPDC056930]
ITTRHPQQLPGSGCRTPENPETDDLNLEQALGAWLAAGESRRVLAKAAVWGGGPVVVERVLRSSVLPDEVPTLTCRVCGIRDDISDWHDGAHRIHQLSRNCGVSLAVRRADVPDRS